MSNPITRKSVDAQTASGSGSAFRTLGHVYTTLFASAKNLDVANDTLEVALECSPNGDVWAEVTSFSVGDFAEDPDNAGDYTATSFATGEYYEYLRARVKSFTDNANGDLEVDVWVMTGGNAGQGRKGVGRDGPVPNP